MLKIATELPADGEAIVVARKDRPVVATLAAGANVSDDIASLAPQQYRLVTVHRGRRRVLLVVGGDDVGVLYGAYRLAERLGVRFYLHGDVIPDQPAAWRLPELDETGKPLFEIRGVNPWGSHAFGFDAWNADDYMAIISQLAKMRMNFIGLHCYPEGHPYAEPTVWLGTTDAFDANGAVLASYPASYYNTLLSPAWGGMAPGRTSAYHYGAAGLFARDDWAPDAMVGQCPRPNSPAGCNAVFNRTGAMFREAFGFARSVGVKACIGTETPLTIPSELAARLRAKGIDPNSARARREVYEGTFRRIAAAHPLDYYWLWTPEGWTWKGNTPEQFRAVTDDIRAAAEALKASGATFKLATSGWVLGPAQDRTALAAVLPKNIPVSALSRLTGHEPIDPAFARITGRDKWAIPWLEDDNNLASPQLWVGRGRKDAADALAYGCTGLLALNWRTRILGPNVSAIAQAGWDQSPWNPALGEVTETAVPKSAAMADDAAAGEGDMPARMRGKWRGMDTRDFYADWARAMFGPEAAGPVADVFVRIDGNLPRVTTSGCPAGLRPDGRPWDKVAPEFAFVDELAACGKKVRGPGSRARFEYWLGTMRYLRATARLRCSLGELTAALRALRREKDANARSRQAEETLVPIYRDVVARTGEAYRELLGTVCTNGGLGTIAYWEHVFLPKVIEKAGRSVTLATGKPLPADVTLPTAYRGPARLIVPAVRTHAANGEMLTVRAAVLAETRPSEVALHWRPMGSAGAFERIEMTHVNRGVYEARLPADATRADAEYYVSAVAGETKLTWPATAPKLNQTVVIVR